MANALRLRFTNGPVVPMPDLTSSSQRPTEAFFVALSANGFEDAVFLSIDEVSRYAMQPNEDIETVLEAVVDGSLPAGAAWETPVEHPDPRTPLSIECDRHTYIVFYIRQGNCQFAETEFPFKVQKGKEKMYLHARCAWRTSAGKLKIAKKAAAGSHSKVALFVARCHEDKKAGSGKFVTAYNIYVDVTDSSGNVLVPAAEVDPDVGYPGGNNVGP